jgi:hypothetical protein
MLDKDVEITIIVDIKASRFKVKICIDAIDAGRQSDALVKVVTTVSVYEEQAWCRPMPKASDQVSKFIPIDVGEVQIKEKIVTFIAV